MKKIKIVRALGFSIVMLFTSFTFNLTIKAEENKTKIIYKLDQEYVGKYDVKCYLPKIDDTTFMGSVDKDNKLVAFPYMELIDKETGWKTTTRQMVLGNDVVGHQKDHLSQLIDLRAGTDITDIREVNGNLISYVNQNIQHLVFYANEQETIEIIIRPYSHRVTFMDDTKVVEVQNIADGRSALAPSMSDKEDDDYVYTFKNWDQEFNNIKNDVVVKAVYEKNAKEKLPVTIPEPPVTENTSPATPGVVPANLVTTPTPIQPVAQVVEQIAEEQTPKAQLSEKIVNEKTPKAKIAVRDSNTNLIVITSCSLLGLFLLLLFFKRRKKEEV